MEDSWREKYTKRFEPFIKENEKLLEGINWKYRTNNEIAIKIRDWLINRRESNNGISIVHICNMLKMSKGTFHNYRREPFFKELFEAIHLCVEEFWVECLGTDFHAARFILSTMEGYTEVTKQIVTPDSFTININKPKNILDENNK